MNWPISNAQPGCDVLLAVDGYLPWSGGSRIYYDNLYRRLAEQHGFRVKVQTTHCSGDDAFDVGSAARGVEIRRQGIRFPDWKLKRAPALAGRALEIARAAIRTSPAAIHCGDLFPQDLAGMLLRKTAELPFLVFVHGDEISQTEGRRVQPRVRNAIYRSADAVVAANTYAYERAAAICGHERVCMITPGVDCDAFHPGGRPTWIAEGFELGSSPVVVTVGRLVKKKGHETMLRSLPALRRSIPDVKYLVVGGGPEENYLKALVQELGIADCVRFTGDVPHHQLGDFYRAGDVFCMVNQKDDSGDIESFGMVFIEAGACGKAVIGGRSGGTTQSILEGRTGLLCEPGNSTQLSEMLLLLLTNKDLQNRLGDSGLSRARAEFDWEVRAAQLAEIHRSITKSRAQGARETHSCSPR